jgi:ribosomal protein L31E
MLLHANTLSTSTRGYVYYEGDRVGEREVLMKVLQLHGVTFKKRAPRAIKEIKAFATKAMVQEPST